MSLPTYWIRHGTRNVLTNIRKLWISHPLYARTHYQTLGLPSAASQADIKRAYYDLSMKYHPDKDKDGEEKFREISTAYEVLGNTRLRRMYDRGLLSDEQPDASIHYPTESSGGGSTGYSSETIERTKASVKTFDKWAQDHTTETFQRSQYEKEAQSKRQNVKSLSQSSSTDTMVFVFILLVIAILVALAPDMKSRNISSDKKKS